MVENSKRKRLLVPTRLSPIADGAWCACFAEQGELVRSVIVAWALCEVWNWEPCRDEPWQRSKQNGIVENQLITGVIIEGPDLVPVDPQDKTFLGYLQASDLPRNQWWFPQVDPKRKDKP